MWAVLLVACLANPRETAIVEEIEQIQEIHEYNGEGRQRWVVYRFRDKSPQCDALVTIESQAGLWMEDMDFTRGVDGRWCLTWTDNWNIRVQDPWDGKYSIVPMSIVRHVRARSYEVVHTTYDWDCEETARIGDGLRRGLRGPPGIMEIGDGE